MELDSILLSRIDESKFLPKLQVDRVVILYPIDIIALLTGQQWVKIIIKKRNKQISANETVTLVIEAGDGIGTRASKE